MSNNLEIVKKDITEAEPSVKLKDAYPMHEWKTLVNEKGDVTGLSLNGKRFKVPHIDKENDTTLLIIGRILKSGFQFEKLFGKAEDFNVAYAQIWNEQLRQDIKDYFKVSSYVFDGKLTEIAESLDRIRTKDREEIQNLLDLALKDIDKLPEEEKAACEEAKLKFSEQYVDEITNAKSCYELRQIALKYGYGVIQRAELYPLWNNQYQQFAYDEEHTTILTQLTSPFKGLDTPTIKKEGQGRLITSYPGGKPIILYGKIKIDNQILYIVPFIGAENFASGEKYSITTPYNVQWLNEETFLKSCAQYLLDDRIRERQKRQDINKLREEMSDLNRKNEILESTIKKAKNSSIFKVKKVLAEGQSTI